MNVLILWGKIFMNILCLIMKYLIKTTDNSALEEVEHVRVVWDTTDDNVLIQNTIGGGG